MEVWWWMVSKEKLDNNSIKSCNFRHHFIRNLIIYTYALSEHKEYYQISDFIGIINLFSLRKIKICYVQDNYLQLRQSPLTLSLPALLFSKIWTGIIITIIVDLGSTFFLVAIIRIHEHPEIQINTIIFGKEVVENRGLFICLT